MEHDVQVQQDARGDWYWHCHFCGIGGELVDTEAEARQGGRDHSLSSCGICGHFHAGENHPLAPCGDYRCCIN